MAVITRMIFACFSRQRADATMLYTIDNVSRDGKAEAFPGGGVAKPSVR